MQYYFIYSAGGGGGEWNGLKRIWADYMKLELKSHILIKFGDIFFNHENVGRTLYKPNLWTKLEDTRKWIYDNTEDEYVLNESDIILDSGTAKAVSWIASHNSDLEPIHFIEKFDEIVEECGLIEKYVNVVRNSKINLAVTLDIPNPFKVRASSNSSLNLINTDDNEPFIEVMAKYANRLHSILDDGETDRLLTIINGLWTVEEYNLFLRKLTYTPKNIAVGALSALRGRAFKNALNEVDKYELDKYERVHFLGCGGMEKVKILKEHGYGDGKYSVDCSSPINRSFADRISKYYIYGTNKKIEVSANAKNQIIGFHEQVDNPYYSVEEMSDIIDLVIQHQEGEHTPETFDARAKLMLHNSDVFRKNAL